MQTSVKYNITNCQTHAELDSQQPVEGNLVDLAVLAADSLHRGDRNGIFGHLLGHLRRIFGRTRSKAAAAGGSRKIASIRASFVQLGLKSDDKSVAGGPARDATGRIWGRTAVVALWGAVMKGSKY